MAFGDDNFNILIKTTADTSGITKTSDAIEDLKKKAAAPVSVPTAPPQVSSLATQIGGAIGSFATGLVGGLAAVAPALVAVYKGFNQLNEELDKWADKMIELHEKTRQMALDFVDAKEFADHLAAIRDLPLIERLAALRSELARVKEEQK